MTALGSVGRWDLWGGGWGGQESGGGPVERGSCRWAQGWFEWVVRGRVGRGRGELARGIN